MASYAYTVSVTVQDGRTSGLGTYSGGPKIVVNGTSIATTKIYSANNTSASPVTYTVAAVGGLVDAFGNALTYTTVIAVAIQNLSGSASIVVGGGGNALFGTDVYTIKPNQTLWIPNVPITVSGSVKSLLLTPSASAAYNVIILGN